MKQLTKQELVELNEALKEFSPSLLGFGNYMVTASQENNKLIITIEEKDYQKEFEDYLKTLDDDIFVEACAQYTKKTGQDLSKIKEITPQLINNFKTIVKIVAKMKVDAIREKYSI
jgi:hypothetical protein